MSQVMGIGPVGRDRAPGEGASRVPQPQRRDLPMGEQPPAPAESDTSVLATAWRSARSWSPPVAGDEALAQLPDLPRPVARGSWLVTKPPHTAWVASGCNRGAGRSISVRQTAALGDGDLGGFERAGQLVQLLEDVAELGSAALPQGGTERRSRRPALRRSRHATRPGSASPTWPYASRKHRHSKGPKSLWRSAVRAPSGGPARRGHRMLGIRMTGCRLTSRLRSDVVVGSRVTGMCTGGCTQRRVLVGAPSGGGSLR